MIRSVKLSLKFVNKQKRNDLNKYLVEYRRILQWFVNDLWNSNVLYRFATKKTLNRCNTWLSVRSKSCASKQALDIIRRALKRHKQRVWRYNKLKNEGESVKHLQKFIDNPPQIPDVNNMGAELDKRFVKINDENKRSIFDLWITFGSLGNGWKIVVPIKKTKQFNKWSKLGKIKGSVVLMEEFVLVIFDIKPVLNIGQCVIGIDLGMKNIISCSNNQQITQNKDGYTFLSICKQLARRKKCSKGFRRAQEHRKNFINWSINQLNLTNIREIKVENIKNMREGTRSSRLLSHFAYAKFFSKLELLCEEKNVFLTRIDQAYTSQKCSKCAYIQAKNRQSSRFKCCKCGYKSDADLNAAKNIVAS